MKHILACILLCVPAVVSAADHYATARVIQQDCQGRTCAIGYASAVAIGAEYLLTCGHGHNLGPCLVDLPEGRVEGRFVRIDKQADLGLVKLKHRGRMAYHYPIADGDPIPQSTVCINTHHGRPATRVARVQSMGSGIYFLDRPAQQGDSGAGVVAESHLVGILVATDSRSSVVVSTAAIRTFLGLSQQQDASLPQDATAVDGTTAGLLRELQEIKSRLDSLELIPGPRGPQGPAGERGSAGPSGKDADQATINALQRRVEALESTQIPVQIIDGKGNVISEQRFPLGQPLKFRLVPE